MRIRLPGGHLVAAAVLGAFLQLAAACGSGLRPRHARPAVKLAVSLCDPPLPPVLEH